MKAPVLDNYINYCHINTIPNVTITIPTTLIKVIINNNWSQLFLGSSEDDHTILDTKLTKLIF